MITYLDKAEKIGVLPSVEQWLELRQLRNQMTHEYIEDFNNTAWAPRLSKALSKGRGLGEGEINKL